MISDSYLLRYIIEQTRRPDPIIWQESGNTHSARIFENTPKELELVIERLQDRAGVRVCLALASKALLLHNKPHKIWITEPRGGGIFGKKYETEDEQEVAWLLRELEKAVSKQCAERTLGSEDDRNALKQQIFEIVLFEKSP